MSKMTDQLIERLVADLKPQDLLIDSKLWMHCTICLIVLAGAVLAIMGLRVDYLNALENGSMFWKPGIFLACWIGSIFLILDFSRPISKSNKWHFTPILLAISIFLWQIIVQSPFSLISDVTISLHDPNAIYCLAVIIGGGGMTMAISWKFWFVKTASPEPSTLGALAGFSAGCLAATAYALHCDKDGALYIFVNYGLPILALTAFGSFLSKRLLRW